MSCNQQIFFLLEGYCSAYLAFAMPDPRIAIHIDCLTKTYKKRGIDAIHALNSVTLDVQQGEVFALLGRNAAGKTSLIRILTTLLRPTSGEASVGGFDVVQHPLEARQKICAVLQDNAVESYLTVYDNLRTFSLFHQIPQQDFRRRFTKVVELFELEALLKTKAMDLSGGVKRRLQVAKVFLSTAPIVFLDDPTTGMDPITKLATLGAIREEARQGRTFFLTTHILSEAEEVSTKIGLIDHGRMLAVGDLSQITALVSDRLTVRISLRPLTDDFIRKLGELPIERLNRRGDTVEFAIKRTHLVLLTNIVALASDETVASFDVHGTSLEDAYLELLGDREETGT